MRRAVPNLGWTVGLMSKQFTAPRDGNWLGVHLVLVSHDPSTSDPQKPRLSRWEVRAPARRRSGRRAGCHRADVGDLPTSITAAPKHLLRCPPRLAPSAGHDRVGRSPEGIRDLGRELFSVTCATNAGQCDACRAVRTLAAGKVRQLLADFLADDEYRELQQHLSRDPEAGDCHPWNWRLPEAAVGGYPEAQRKAIRRSG